MSDKNGDSVVKLRKPISFPDGKTIESISIDVDKLSWQDLHNLEMEYAAVFPNQVPTNGIYVTDTKYQALMIARLNGLIYDQMAPQIRGRDAITLTQRLGLFLQGVDLSTPAGPSSVTEAASASPS